MTKSGFHWDKLSEPSLVQIRGLVTAEDYFQKLSLLWSQESSKNGGNVDLRSENVLYIKSLGLWYPLIIKRG
jgi:proteasome activator subunit 4